LVTATGKNAAQKTVGLVVPLKAREGLRGGNVFGGMVLAPHITNVSANVESGPGRPEMAEAP
jgi:hypothetical protein